MALMWVDRERRYFISTTSTSLDGSPYVRYCWRQMEGGPKRIEIKVRQLQVCEIYYNCCAQIDRCNRCRQDDLNIEKKIGTHDWSFRVNSSLLGIHIVDSWLLYSGVQGDRLEMNQRTFYETLATELIDNKHDRRNLRRRSRTEEEENITESRIGIHLTRTNQKRKLKDGSSSSHAMQKLCRICEKYKTTLICS